MKVLNILTGLLASSLLIPAAMAEPVHRETPGKVEHKVELGENIWHSRAFEGTPGIILTEPLHVQWDEDESMNVSAGSEFVIIREGSLKVCQKRTVTHIRGVPLKGWDKCLIDKDGDGAFDLITKKRLGKSRPISPQIRYKRQLVPLQGQGAWAKRKSLTFRGMTSTTILMSYREFSNNYLTPNFSDDLTIPRPKKFPAVYAIKGRKLTILSLDNSGMRYKLD